MMALIGIFAYLGPETMLPMTSAVAGAIGVVMLLGRGSLRWVVDRARSVKATLKPKSKSKPGAGTRRIGKGPTRSIRSTTKDQTPL